jgi:hypothetical protein
MGGEMPGAAKAMTAPRDVWQTTLSTLLTALFTTTR